VLKKAFLLGKRWDEIPLSSSFPGSAWECMPGGSAASSIQRWQSHQDMRSQAEPAEPGNEHWRWFALSLAAMPHSRMHPMHPG